MHFHIFAIQTERDAQGNPVDKLVTFSQHSARETGERVAYILSKLENIHIEQVMRCGRELPRGAEAIYCPAIMETVPVQVAETPYGYHWHLVKTFHEEEGVLEPPRSSYAACAHQLEHMEAEAQERGFRYSLVKCATELSDDHPTVDECGVCGFGKLLSPWYVRKEQ